MAGKTDYKGYVEIAIAGHPFRLDGNVGDTIAVGFRAGVDGAKEVKIGTLLGPDGVVTSVGEALLGKGNGEKMKTALQSVNDALSQTGGLLDIIDKLFFKLEIYVTDLFIKAEKKENSFTITKGAFGFRCEFPESDPAKLGPIELKGFGVVFEYTVDADGNPDGEAVTNPEPA